MSQNSFGGRIKLPCFSPLEQEQRSMNFTVAVVYKTKFVLHLDIVKMNDRQIIDSFTIIAFHASSQQRIHAFSLF